MGAPQSQARQSCLSEMQYHFPSDAVIGIVFTAVALYLAVQFVRAFVRIAA